MYIYCRTKNFLRQQQYYSATMYKYVNEFVSNFLLDFSVFISADVQRQMNVALIDSFVLDRARHCLQPKGVKSRLHFFLTVVRISPWISYRVSRGA
jgi:hypothetical protein